LKAQSLANYFVVLTLSVVSAGLYFAPQKSINLDQQIQLPALINLEINQQTFLTKTTEVSAFEHTVEQVMREQKIDFKNRLSPVYAGIASNYLMTFFESAKSTAQNKDIHFIIFKKTQDLYRIVVTLKVKDLNDERINLSVQSHFLIRNNLI
jgi:hypothetical protein